MENEIDDKSDKSETGELVPSNDKPQGIMIRSKGHIFVFI
jgi:hypothetical protein